MTEFDREEAAFRTALALHAADGEQAPFRARHRHWRAPLLIAVTVLAVVGAAVGIAGTKGHKTEPSPASYWDGREAQWVSFRDIEVKAPADWPAAYEAVRPDCIQVRADGSTADDMWSADVPRSPYVAFGSAGGVIPTIGCARHHSTDDPDPAFGDVPFSLWQPHVRILPARPDLDLPDRQDAHLNYRGWHLTRTTTHGVQITILSAPGDDELGAAVLGSLRVVTTNHLGCRADSEVLSQQTTDLDTGPLPDPDNVASISVCEYQASQFDSGLGPSRQITGAAARDLVRAIADAPSGRGPGSGRTCRHNPAERALVLLFFGPDDAPTHPLASSRAYFGSCPDNGFVGAGGEHVLTRGNCAPMFERPPIGFWFGSKGTYPLCYTS